MKPVTIIAAVARNGVIGYQGSIPWFLPEDLRHFKARTEGHSVIMGRKTWESLPCSVRPLPGRQNIVVSSDQTYEAVGATTAGSLPLAIQLASVGEVFIIGGATLYWQALPMPMATKMILTQIDDDYHGDTYFPPFDNGEWLVTECLRRDGYAFVTYERALGGVSV